MFRRSRAGSKTRLGRWACGVAAWGVVGVGVIGVGCREEPYPFDPRQLGQRQRDASRYQASGAMAPLPGKYEPFTPFRNRVTTTQATTRSFEAMAMGHEPLAEITLEDVVHRTVIHSLDVRASGYGPAIDAARVIEAEAAFDPTFFSSFQADVTDRTTAGSIYTDPSTYRQTSNAITGSTLTGGTSRFLNRQQSQIYTAQVGIRQTLETGAQISLLQQVKQTENKPQQTIIDPYREADLILQITQPLLQNFGASVNRARIDLARNQQRQTLLEFRKQVEESAFNVEQLYWQLWQAQRNVEFLEQAVGQAEKDTDVIANRRRTDATADELAQAQADMATRGAQLVAARATVRDVSDRIKTTMNDPGFPVGDATLLVIRQAPPEQPVAFDRADLVNTALEHRLELGQQQLKVDAATITLGAAKNNLLPKLDLKGQLNPMGLTARDFGAGISNESDLNRLSYSLGLEFEVPLGNREAEAIYRRTLLQRYQGEAAYQSAVDQVTADVIQSARDVESKWGQLAKHREARLNYLQVLSVYDAQTRAGQELTPYFVRLKLDTELRVLDERISEAQALADYNIALAKLERSKGTLLKYNNITLEEEGLARE